MLPYGFVQSPILATLAIDQSVLGSYLNNGLPAAVFVSVYLDDITISSDDKATLAYEYDLLRLFVEEAGFVVNHEKCTPPTETLTVFNCHLTQSATMVTTERATEFYKEDRSEEGVAAFERYCAAVAAGSIGAQ